MEKQAFDEEKKQFEEEKRLWSEQRRNFEAQHRNFVQEQAEVFFFAPLRPLHLFHLSSSIQAN